MPSDIIGTEILEEDHGTGRRMFKFQKGPVFTNLLLADELNRTPPKTQAALLEAMQEHTVSYGGTTYPLPAPFFVLATQNPLEQAGTYPLPEAQLDRFLLHIRVPYPSETEEHAILARTTGSSDAQVPRVLGGDALLRLQALVREVHVGDALMAWINRLVRSTRPGEAASAEVRNWVRWGAGPRAGQSLVLAAKARALMHGRLAATREDVAALAAPVMRHRLLLSFAAEAEAITAREARLAWQAPSRDENTAGAAVRKEESGIWRELTQEQPDEPQAVVMVQGGRERGLILHKLMEEVLTGETDATAERLAERAGELIRALGGAPASDPASGLSTQELSDCVIRTLSLPEIAALRRRLCAEYPLYAAQTVDKTETVTVGVADALALTIDGVPDIVVDWKSDVAPNAETLEHYSEQVRTYIDMTGANRGLIVLMTSGDVISVPPTLP